MSFFRKLKDRLLKSSSKIEEGLDAIVGEDDSEEVLEDPIDDPAMPDQGGESAKLNAELIEAPTSPSDEMVAGEAAQPAPEAEKPKKAKKETPKTQQEPKPEPDPEPVPEPEVKASPEPAPAQKTETETKPRGLLGRLRPKAEPKRVLDDEMLEALEEMLIQTDMGVDVALKLSAQLAAGRMGQKLSKSQIQNFLAESVAKVMAPVARPMPLYPQKPQIVLVVGVNGSGKTTTIGKLASQFRDAGKSVVIAACDTFRAAAVEQLQIWGERSDVPVLTAPEGTDPASLAFKAIEQAQADGADLLMIDTAGRLQNRKDLMEELAKIVRVIRKKDPDAPHNTLLVLDATTGQNALNQVEIFKQVADVSGLVMTKLDGTAKGGVLLALADRFGLPIHAIGVGEAIDDLSAFDPEEFASALTGAAGG